MEKPKYIKGHAHNIPLHEIAQIMGFENLESVTEPFSSYIETVAKKLFSLTEFHVEWIEENEVRWEKETHQIITPMASFSVNKVIFSLLKKSEKVVFFISTTGSKAEAYIKQCHLQNDPAIAYVADTIGSVLAEQVATYAHNVIAEEVAKKGLKTTNKYSPGYCKWPVDEQHKLFRYFPNNRSGITLNDSALMTPIKSVSGMIGVGRNVKYNNYTCHLCNQKDCAYAR